MLQLSKAWKQLSFFPILLFHHSFFCLEAPVHNYYLWEGDSIPAFAAKSDLGISSADIHEKYTTSFTEA